MNETSKVNEEQPAARTMKDYLRLLGSGFAMGCADVVPGVSGGTMAFILGIYEELIESIRSLSQPETIKIIMSAQIKKGIEVLPWRFLGAVLLGIALAIVSLAPALEWILETYPALLWAFFFGLVVASIAVIRTRVTTWKPLTIGGLVVGTVLAYIFVGMVPVETPETWWFLFLSGAVAICAMILPGISGSFLLLLLGKYQYVLGAVSGLIRGVTSMQFEAIFANLYILIFVGLGAVVGIITFARFLSWLFRRYHDITVALLIGLMAGSLRKIWPWKETIETYVDRHGEIKPLVQANIIPALSTEVLMAIVLAIVGFAVVFALERLASQQEQQAT